MKEKLDDLLGGYGVDGEDPVKKGLVVGLLSLNKIPSKETSCREFDSFFSYFKANGKLHLHTLQYGLNTLIPIWFLN